MVNFQGRLATPSGNPVPNGTYSVRFSLHDALTAGTEKWNQTVASVQVKDGVFAVPLDVSTGAADKFNGNLWLEVKVGADAALTPRTQLVTVPYAFKAGSVVDGSITSASIANGILSAANFPANFFNSTAWLLGGNSATNPATYFLGTTDNEPLNLRVNNRRALRITYVENIAAAFRTFNMLGGADANSIGANVVGATIAGGGNAGINSTDLPNVVNSDYGFLGGGYYNLIDTNAVNSVIGGGFQNNINTGAGNSAIVGGEGNSISAAYAFIGGGSSNQAGGANSFVGGGVLSGAGGANSVVVGGNNNIAIAQYSAVLGGNSNIARGTSAFIGGGNSNRATRPESTVGGGKLNTATGDQSTIGGGESNVASAAYATVGGGVRNTAAINSAFVGGGVDNAASGPVSFIGGGFSNSTSGRNSAIAGGSNNITRGDNSSISGGIGNEAIGSYATIPGGYFNLAYGIGSFAGGVRALANHSGTFVWADNHDAYFASSAENQFSIRAFGGMVFDANGSMPLYTAATSGEKNRYLFLLNSPQTPSASGLKAGGILCADSYGYANPGKNDVVIKGTLGVGYTGTAPYVAAFNGNTFANGQYLSSDARYKKNIVSLDNALESVLSLRCVSYDWDRAKFPQQNFGDGKQIGFVAQEIEKIFPYLVMTSPDGYKAVNYTGVIPVLVEAVKTLNARTIIQQKQNDALKLENAELRARLDRIEAALEIRK